MQIGDFITRYSPIGDIVDREIKNEEQLAYYQDLESKGFTIIVKTPEELGS